MFYRKSFCGYARIDAELNYTSDVGREEDVVNNNRGLFSQLIIVV